jgi:glycosyltransferase involved in cell wall biosynthesis
VADLPRILPTAARDRPFWSVMIPTYDSGELLSETLSSVLRQDPGPAHMQIEVVDDHSTRSDPEQLVRRVAGDRVSFYRQPSNVGHTANFNTCLARSRGEVIHLLHDDDLVLPGFYERLESAYRCNDEIGSAVTRHVFADASGQWRSLARMERPTAGIAEGWLRTIASGMCLTTPAVTMRRTVVEEIGGFDPRIRGGEDWEMYVRIATRFPVWYEPEPLAVYRYARPGSLTGEAVGTTVLVSDMLVAAEIVESYLDDFLPSEEARRILRRARRLYGRWSFESAAALLGAGQWRPALASIRLGFEASPSLAMVGALATTLLSRGLHRLDRRLGH